MLIDIKTSVPETFETTKQAIERLINELILIAMKSFADQKRFVINIRYENGIFVVDLLNQDGIFDSKDITVKRVQ